MWLIGGCLLVGIVCSSRRRLSILAGLAGASSVMMTWQLGGLHYFTLSCALLLLLGKPRRLPPTFVLIVVFAALAAASVLVGKYVTQPSAALQLIGLSFSATILVSILDGKLAVIFMRGMVSVTTASCVVATAELLGVISYGHFALETAENHRPSGLFPEPDWLGYSSLVGLILLVRADLAPRRAMLPLSLLHFGVLVSASARAALLGLLVVLVVLLAQSLLAVGRNVFLRRLAATIFLSVMVLPVVVPAQVALFAERLVAAGDTTRGNVGYRYSQIVGLKDLALSAPWYGNGLTSSGRIDGYGNFVSGPDLAGTAGSNLFWSLVGDAGVAGLGLICLVGLVAFRARQSVGGLLLIATLVNAQFSNNFYFPAFWACLALAGLGLGSDRQKNFLKDEGLAHSRAGGPFSLGVAR